MQIGKNIELVEVQYSSSSYFECADFTVRVLILQMVKESVSTYDHVSRLFVISKDYKRFFVYIVLILVRVYISYSPCKMFE